MMSSFTVIARQLLGMFVDDGSLALAILAIVGTAAVSGFWLDTEPLTVGAILIFGCLAVLIENVLRASRKGSSQ
jgi:hypothetical protein